MALTTLFGNLTAESTIPAESTIHGMQNDIVVFHQRFADGFENDFT